MKKLRRIKKCVKFIINNIESIFIRGLEYLVILNTKRKRKKIIHSVKQKKEIIVAFVIIHGSVWKYEELYQLFDKDQRYKPFIVICPYTSCNEANMFREMKIAEQTFNENSYRVYNTYDKDNNTWKDFKNTINPNIVFFTNPHNLTREEYTINNFKDRLTCYCQYSFHITHLNKIQYDQLFHNLLWKYFCETKTHLEIAKKNSRIKASNVVVTGYPGVDILTSPNYQPLSPWKECNSVKKIIWAPHHTIEGSKQNLGFSTFLAYYDYFVYLVNKKKSIQIAFKPHPVLRARLEKKKMWGLDKTKEYYQFWQNVENGQLEVGRYEDLFLTSDALIFDSASFMTEYLFTRKPSMFLVSDNNISDRFNIFGKKVFNVLYHAYNTEDIENFIDNIVLRENDFKKEKREELIISDLIINDGLDASIRIKRILDNELSYPSDNQKNKNF